MVPVFTPRVETRTLWLTIVVSSRGEDLEQLVILYTLASVRARKELLGTGNRVEEGVPDG